MAVIDLKSLSQEEVEQHYTLAEYEYGIWQAAVNSLNAKWDALFEAPKRLLNETNKELLVRHHKEQSNYLAKQEYTKMMMNVAKIEYDRLSEFLYGASYDSTKDDSEEDHPKKRRPKDGRPSDWLREQRLRAKRNMEVDRDETEDQY